MRDVKRLLEQYHFNILIDMARLLHIPATSSKKVDHVKALAAALFTPPITRKGISLLGRRETQALAAIQRAGGRIEANRLRLQLLRQGVIESTKSNDPYAYPYMSGVLLPEERRTSFQAVVGRLMAVGLVCGEGTVETLYSTRTRIYYDNVQTLYIPDVVAPALPEPQTVVKTQAVQTGDLHIQEGSARAFQRDLYFYWSTTRANSLTLTQQGRLYKKDLQLVNSALLQPQELGREDELGIPRLLFLRLLLTDLGLLQQGSGGVDRKRMIQAADRPQFLGQRPMQRISRTFKQWRDGSFWNEMLSIPRITIGNGGTRLDPTPQKVTEARRRVLQHIAELHRTKARRNPEQKASNGQDESRAIVPVAEQWTPIEQLVDQIRSHDYDFLLPRDYRPTRSSSYYYAYYGYTSSSRSPYISYGNELGWSFSPAFQDEAEGWEVVEAGFIRAILTEPLCWMGLVDIGYGSGPSRTPIPIAYRLTPVGAQVLGVGPQVEIPEGEGKVVVQPNFEIFALDPISDLDLANLDQFADRVNAERAIKYHLTRESVYRAQRNGWTASRILDTLQTMSARPGRDQPDNGAPVALPQNVERTLQEWQDLHERITIHRKASLLQAVDGQTMDCLAENPSVGPHLLARPGETVALLSSQPGKADELVGALQEAGYPPARTRSPEDSIRPSLTIADSGQLLFAAALPSIYLFEQVAPFTWKDEQGRHFLTQSAVQEATEHGLTVQEILSRLQQVHLGPLPRWVEIKIRAWGGYYGNAAMETITLVQIRDEKTLGELLAEPEIKDVLRPFSPSKNRGLALVSTDDVELLRQLLAERGMSVEERLR